MIDSLPVFSWRTKVLEGFWNNRDQQFFDSDFFEELRLKNWENKIGMWICMCVCVCVCVCVLPQNLMERKIN
jgi:hypothetical protein